MDEVAVDQVLGKLQLRQESFGIRVYRIDEQISELWSPCNSRLDDINGGVFTALRL